MWSCSHGDVRFLVTEAFFKTSLDLAPEKFHDTHASLCCFCDSWLCKTNHLLAFFPITCSWAVLLLVFCILIINLVTFKPLSGSNQMPSQYFYFCPCYIYLVRIDYIHANFIKVRLVICGRKIARILVGEPLVKFPPNCRAVFRFDFVNFLKLEVPAPTENDVLQMRRWTNVSFSTAWTYKVEYKRN